MEPVIVVGDDAEGRRVAKMLAQHNIAVLSAGLAAGLSLDGAMSMCAPINRTPARPRELTTEDRERMAMAEAKRERRAMKRTAGCKAVQP